MGRPPRLALTSSSYPTQFADIDDIAVARMLSHRAGVPHQVLRDRVSRFPREVTANRQFDFCVNEHAWSIPLMAQLKAHTRSCYAGPGGDALYTAPQVQPELTDLVARNHVPGAPETRHR